MGRGAGVISLSEFIDGQQFVDPASEAVKAMRKMIDEVDAAS